MSKDIKVVKIGASEAKPIIEAISKKQDFKNKVMSGEVEVKVVKGARFA
jgi:hypothetical protein